MKIKLLNVEIEIRAKKIEKLETPNLVIDQAKRKADYEEIVSSEAYQDIKAKAAAYRAQRAAVTS